MKIATFLCAAALLLTVCSGAAPQHASGEWISLFDGRSLAGWKASEHPATFSVEEGRIVVHGPRAHLFYVGPVEEHDFEDFEFEAEVMTMPGANSGIYFHTRYQEEGWPSEGHEVQVNNSYTSDPRKTASLYGLDDVDVAPVSDETWFTMYIKVQDGRVVVKVDGETMVDYTQQAAGEQAAGEQAAGEAVQAAPSGTFALQGHDPDSKVYYRNVRVRPLLD